MLESINEPLILCFRGRDSAPRPSRLSSLYEEQEQYPAVLEEISKKMPVEYESDALYLNGEVPEYSDEESNSETDVDNPIHEEL
ncbi:hypothetical protein AVEN_4038-1 [Araneus ventricosus]|uniref:Uncharacterized protein n=1 Tax=Araneus ventricosus TaxID=182803 RepID=A0A4Y2J504_ARAVE|nr:hypothetical protein AVEN_4038-1 [Araneus ventricosus]